MSPKKPERNIRTRRQLFDFLQSQIQATYSDLKENQRLSYESSLIKSYIFEVNAPELLNGKPNEWMTRIFGMGDNPRYQADFIPTDEDAFHQLQIKIDGHELRLYIDAASDPRFWLAYSISESQKLDRWLEMVVRKSIDFDFVWLWPHFLERVQEYGYFRGFGLDYDYRKFEAVETETTTYLKMQLWGGENTRKIYKILQDDNEFRSKVVLSKVRFKQMGGEDHNPDIFAIQDVKYNGKFTARGTDLNTHLVTLNDVRSQYREQILGIEDRYALKWVENSLGGASLEGYAIHFIPNDFEIPVSLLVEKLFDGTEPFRLLGFPNLINEHSAVMEVVDLHTGGKLSIELHPDVMTVYLPEYSCGNTIARLYTNIQHSFNVGFRVETDHGDELFS
jgi:hypothetical protein